MDNPWSQDGIWDVAILGAGCSGMSLAWRLFRGGYKGSVAVLDRRADFAAEQNWFVWGPVEKDLQPFVAQRWMRWQAKAGKEPGAKGRYRAIHDLQEKPLLHIYAPDMLEKISEQIEQANMRLSLENEVGFVVERSTYSEIETRRSTLRARLVFDARAAIAMPDQSVIGSDVWLWRTYLGQVVSTKTPAFDIRTATLMDFEAPGAPQDTFISVYPFKETEALIVSNLIAARPVEAQRHREHIGAYVDTLFKADWEAVAEEQGKIPITTRKFPTQKGKRQIYIGTASGAVKATVGESFGRIQKQVGKIAANLIAGKEPLAGAGDLWHDSVDASIVRQYAKGPGKVEEIGAKFFTKLPPAVIAKFLADDSSPADDSRVASMIGASAGAASSLLRFLKPTAK